MVCSIPNNRIDVEVDRDFHEGSGTNNDRMLARGVELSGGSGDRVVHWLRVFAWCCTGVLHVAEMCLSQLSQPECQDCRLLSLRRQGKGVSWWVSMYVPNRTYGTAHGQLF